MSIKTAGKRLYKICMKNPATMRDRERPTDRTKTICNSCHAIRLGHDLSDIMRYNRVKGIC